MTPPTSLRIAFVCDGIAEFMAGSVESTRRFARLLKDRGHHIVFIAGRAPEHRANDTWEDMRVYRFRSLVELEGMVVLQAMACGVPILIANSSNSASPYFVKENGFLFDPSDAEDLAQKALQLLSNEALRQSMAAESFKAGEQYDIHHSVEEVEHIYTELLAARYTKAHGGNGPVATAK